MCTVLHPSQDNAQFGDHIWFETNGSGDFCYVGEQYCIAKSLVSCSVHGAAKFPKLPNITEECVLFSGAKSRHAGFA